MGIVLTDAQVREWMVNFYSPERLAGPSMRDLLRAHGRSAEGSTWTVYREAQSLLRDKIAALKPDADAPRDAWRPYLVLSFGFVQRNKLRRTADRLGLSTRQVSRERTRAIRLLRGELEVSDRQVDLPLD